MYITGRFGQWFMAKRLNPLKMEGHADRSTTHCENRSRGFGFALDRHDPLSRGIVCGLHPAGSSLSRNSWNLIFPPIGASRKDPSMTRMETSARKSTARYAFRSILLAEPRRET